MYLHWRRRVEGGVEPGGGIPEPGVSPGVEAGSREGGEGTRELHGIEEGVGGGGCLLVRHLGLSDDHHHSVLVRSLSVHSWGLSTWLLSRHRYLFCPPTQNINTKTLTRCFVQNSLDNLEQYSPELYLCTVRHCVVSSHGMVGGQVTLTQV